MRSVHIGVLDTAGAAICWTTSLSISDPERSRARAQSPEPGVFAVVYSSLPLIYAAASLRFRVLCSGSYASHVIQR